MKSNVFRSNLCLCQGVILFCKIYKLRECYDAAKFAGRRALEGYPPEMTRTFSSKSNKVECKDVENITKIKIEKIYCLEVVEVEI